MRWLNNIGCWTQHTEPLSESLMCCQATSIKDVQKVLQIRCVWMFFFSETGSTQSCRFSLHNIRGFSALCCLFCILSSQHWATEPRSCQLLSCAVRPLQITQSEKLVPRKISPASCTSHVSLTSCSQKHTSSHWRHLKTPVKSHSAPRSIPSCPKRDLVFKSVDEAWLQKKALIFCNHHLYSSTLQILIGQKAIACLVLDTKPTQMV